MLQLYNIKLQMAKATVMRLYAADPTRSSKEIAEEADIQTQDPAKTARDWHSKELRKRARMPSDTETAAVAPARVSAKPPVSSAYELHEELHEELHDEPGNEPGDMSSWRAAPASPDVASLDPAPALTSPHERASAPTMVAALPPTSSPAPSYGALLLRFFDDMNSTLRAWWTSRAERDEWMGDLDWWETTATKFARWVPIRPPHAEDNLTPDCPDDAISAARAITGRAIAPQREFIDSIPYVCAALLQKLPSKERGWSSEPARDAWLAQIAALVNYFRMTVGLSTPVIEAQEGERDEEDTEQ